MTKRQLKTKPYWWLSFATDEGFRGVVILRARSMEEAVTISHRLKLNPGGQVAGFPMPASVVPPLSHVGRLLSKAELNSLGGEFEVKRIGDWEAMSEEERDQWLEAE